ncbi:MAG: hypothetical protein ACE5HC_13505 [Candidatus Binatia bacterium]
MKVFILFLTLMLLMPAASFSQQRDTAVEIRELKARLERLEKTLLQKEAARKKNAREEREAIAKKVKKDVMAEVSTARQPFYKRFLERTKVGGYGSLRYGTSNLNALQNTFTFRRFVLTLDAPIAERLKSYFELEFERFTELELERRTFRTAGGLKVEQAVEGSNESEISLEQGWLQYDIAKWLNFRAGGILVPLGRFNIKHDGNLWDLPRRSLVDRGVSVLPSSAAWTEMGAGLLGDVSVGRQGKFSYQWYVMNGVTLDSEVERVVQSRSPKRDKLEAEIELRPSRGTFSDDLKKGKALAARFVYSPRLGDEIAASFYWGRYTPDFLADRTVFSFALDGKKSWGPFEIEAEYANTRWNGVNSVARSFARTVRDSSTETLGGETALLETEVEFELANLATRKQGYWVDLRYRFWPSFLENTILGKRFSNPQLIATLRGEQVWFSDLLREIKFSSGTLTDFEKEQRLINRLTLGLTYRPLPLAAFTLAYEYTRTNRGKSLSSVTNFLASSRDNEYFQHAVLVGLVFGF